MVVFRNRSQKMPGKGMQKTDGMWVDVWMWIGGWKERELVSHGRPYGPPHP